jgi:hypothetical protein
MYRFILLLLLPVLLFGQTAVYQYGSWLSSSSRTVQLSDTDTDTVFFSFRTTSSSTSVDPDTNTTSYNPPDVVYWSGHGTIEIIPTVVSSDTESDSLQVYVMGVDQIGNIMQSQKVWLDFSSTVGDWTTTAQYLNWTSGTAYNASIGEAFSPCNAIAVFVAQDAADTGQDVDVQVRFIRD